MSVSWSVRARLTAWYAGLLAAILVLFGLALYTLLAHSLWAHAQESLRTRAEQLASFVESSDPTREDGTFFDLADPSVVDRFSAGGVLIQVSDAQGRLVNRSPTLAAPGFPLPRAVRRALDGAASFDRTAVPGVGPLLVHSAPITRRGSIIGVVQIAAPLAPVTEPLERLRWLLLTGGAGAVVVAAAVGQLLAYIALSPIDRITQTARAIGAGARGRRIHLGGPDDEVRRLGQAFDEMLDRIDETLERERRFTADAAHELRTPLTILKGELEVALRRERTPVAYREVLASMSQEVDRLVRLAEDLLTLARADAGGLSLQRAAVPLDAVARWAEEQFAGVARRKGVVLEAHGAGPLTVLGDLDRLRQLLTNLVINAITYTPSEGRVHLAWDREAPFARIIVGDTGCGIEPEDLPHLFQRFYRADRARARSAGGSGLGLPIAEWIVKAHGGRIEVDSFPGRGTTVTVWLPLADPG